MALEWHGAMDLHVGAGKAISLGLAPFLAGDAIKAGIAALLLPGAWSLLTIAESASERTSEGIINRTVALDYLSETALLTSL